MDDETRADPFANSDEWAIYEREDGHDDRWTFVGFEGGCEGDPGSAARHAAAHKWTSGKHFLLAVGAAGAYEYEITFETKGPVV